MRIGIVLILVATTVLLPAEAAEIQVGGGAGWGLPSPPTFYSTWAAGQTFTLGDVLVFNFPTGGHDVAGVTKDNYDNCIADNPNFVNQTSPFSFPLDSVADFYFICTVPGHCAAGQKLAITNIQQPSSSGPPPPSTPNSPPVSGDQPPPATPDSPPVSGDQPPPATPDSPPVTGDQPPPSVVPPPPNSASTTLASVFAVAFASIAAAFIIF